MTPTQRLDGDGNIQAGGNVDVRIFSNNRPDSKAFYPKDIQNVITGLSSVLLSKYGSHLNLEEDAPNSEFDYTEKEEKNALNSLSDDYFNYIVNDHLAYFTKIDNFLKDSKNTDLLAKYESIASMLRFRINTIRSQCKNFDEVLGIIYSEIIDAHSSELQGHETDCVIILHFMYWNCDIGRKV